GFWPWSWASFPLLFERPVIPTLYFSLIDWQQPTLFSTTVKTRQALRPPATPACPLVMSWKLTKKLKETHLAPLANTFSRSSSTSTITPDPAPKPPNSPLASSTAVNDPNGIAASEANSSPPAPPLKPGILILTFHEGRGFSLPAG
ncbi:hypothetical protein KCU71_g24270, partial [Aureobasidium melanogenum]